VAKTRDSDVVAAAPPQVRSVEAEHARRLAS
jgi:hypothetical protein